MELEKQQVKDFWNAASCGETLFLKGDDERQQFNNELIAKYKLEPFIPEFAEFNKFKDKITLEIGVGLGADHQMLAQSGAILYGCDLTERAIQNTAHRMKLFNLQSNLQVQDAENLTYEDTFFDSIYSWGVIHHSPNTQKAINEIYRVLKKGGEAKIMIYHKFSMVGYMLWFRHALLKLKPFTSLTEIYSKYLESPGTKAYSVGEAKKMFEQFSEVRISTILGPGDLLEEGMGQRHEGVLLNMARFIYPRKLVKFLFPNHGLTMMIKLIK